MTNSILLFGGSSEERLVSAASAQNLAPLFAREKIWFIAQSGAVHEVDAAELERHERPFENEFVARAEAFAPSIEAALERAGGRAVFVGLHGTEGEDGSLQERLESRRIAFTGSDARSSRLCFDKLAAKAEAARAGLRVCEQISFNTRDPRDIEAALAPFLRRARKVILKPVANGSSFGLRTLSPGDSIADAALAIARSGDPRYMAETFAAGREITVGVVDANGRPEALPASEVLMEAGRSFDYAGKYLGRGSREITPADLAPDLARACQEAALRAHAALGCFGYSRTDLILPESGVGEPIFLETNTLPGLTRASFVPQQLAAAGQSLETFVTRQLALARGRAAAFADARASINKI